MEPIHGFVIHVPGTRDASSLMLQLHLAGVKAEIVPAVTFESLGQPPWSDVINWGRIRRIGKPLSLSAASCAASHNSVYRRMVELNLPYALICEDDVDLSANEAQLRAIANQMSNRSPHIIQLFTRGRRFCHRNRILSEFPTHKLYTFAFPPGQTACYMINQSAAYIASESEIDWAADWPSWADNAKFEGVYPWFAKETGEDSLIEQPDISRVQVWGRTLKRLSLLEWLQHRGDFSSLGDYLGNQWLSAVEYQVWRLRGCPSVGSNPESPWPVLFAGKMSEIGACVKAN